jgi:hypothetical protein
LSIRRRGELRTLDSSGEAAFDPLSRSLKAVLVESG